MFLPLSDDDRKLIKPAFVTWLLLTANLLVFWKQYADPAFSFGYAAIPAEVTGNRDFVDPIPIRVSPQKVEALPNAPGPSPIQLTLITSMFMHAGLLHLAGNMLFLWIFGDNVEHRFGHAPFLLFYLGSGLAASLAHVAMNSESIIPSLGASGAIAGVLGAYLVLFPWNQVYVLIFVWMVSVPAFVVIALWFVNQLLGGFENLTALPNAGGVAYAAHIGGFLAGVSMAFVLRQWIVVEPESVFRRYYVADSSAKRLW